MNHDFGQARQGKYECPICHKFNMSVKQVAANNFLVNCFTPECPKGAAWRHFFGKSETPREHVAAAKGNAEKNLWPGITLAEFAEKRGFTVSQLKERGLYETEYRGLETGNVTKTIVAFPVGVYKDGDWTTTAIKLYGGSKDQVKWIKGDTGKKVIFPFGLYGDFLRSEDYLVITEGEANCIALQIHGIPSLGISGASNWKKAYRNFPSIKSAQRIYVVKDPDDGGEQFVSKVTRDLPASKVHIVSFPPGLDANDLHLKCQFDFPAWAAVQRDLQSAFLDSPLSVEARAIYESINEDEYFSLEFGRVLTESEPLKPRPVLQSFSDISLEDVTWLWTLRFPIGMLSLVAGPKGVMKSLFGVWLASALSRGWNFPDSENELPPCDTILFSSEDDPGLTILPRLLAAKADVKRVHVLNFPRSKDDENPSNRQMRLDMDMAAISSALEKNPAVKLLVIDPLSSFIGANMNREQEIRDVLCPFQEMAKQRGVAIIFIAHFNKRSDVEGLDKVMGAGAITGVCRANWLVQEEMNEETGASFIPRRFLLLHGKVNIAREAKGLVYTVEETPVEGIKLPVPVLSWQGYTNKTLNSIASMSDKSGGKGHVLSEGISFLRDFLQTHKPAAEVNEAADAVGISAATLKRAKKALHIETSKFNNVWMLSLPSIAYDGGDPSDVPE